jgi:NAD+ kinase
MNDALVSAPAGRLTKPRTIALIGKYHSPEIAESLRLLAKYLHERNIAVLVEEETALNIGMQLDPLGWVSANFESIGAQADVAIVLGGDGTMLTAARLLARYRVPLVGVNQGRLGFMTDIARDDMLSCMDDLLDGKFILETRMLLDADVLRDGVSILSTLALNDIVVDKGATGRMIEFGLFIDGEFIYNLRSDGLIVATPTGSTAYSLSANGPIMHPQVAGIALVPLCPHALSNRPILIGDSSEIEICIIQAADSRAHFDGQVTVDLKRDDAVCIRRSEYPICFLHPPGYSYFAMLRQKLHWSEQPRVH